MSKEACDREGQSKWYEMSAHIEELVKSEKKLNPNVDFYSASTYYVIGMPIDMFTPFFAVSRMSGWTAHILEQYSNNRLIRPRRIHRTRARSQMGTSHSPLINARRLGNPAQHVAPEDHRDHIGFVTRHSDLSHGGSSWRPGSRGPNPRRAIRGRRTTIPTTRTITSF
jgi:hypothetical protein